MIEVSGRGKDHVAAAEAAAVIVKELLLIELAHRRGGAENRLAERMIFPEILREQLVDQHVRIVFVDLDLFEDHAALALDIGWRRRWD